MLPNEIEKGWMEQVTSETLILFVGRREHDKPTAETLKLLDGATVLGTDERGSITYELDGERRQLHEEK